jgi:hypothetical protein
VIIIDEPETLDDADLAVANGGMARQMTYSERFERYRPAIQRLWTRAREAIRPRIGTPPTVPDYRR